MSADMQYLVDCTDSSYCLVYEYSIIFEGNWKRLRVGDTIEFYYPEDEVNQEKYKGKIVAMSSE